MIGIIRERGPWTESRKYHGFFFRIAGSIFDRSSTPKSTKNNDWNLSVDALSMLSTDEMLRSFLQLRTAFG